MHRTETKGLIFFLQPIWRITLIALGALFGVIGGSLGVLEFWPESQKPISTVVTPPSQIEASTGQGYIAIKWANVPGAVSYRVFRAERLNGAYEPLSISRGSMSRIQRRILAWLLPGLSFEDVSSDLYTDTQVKSGRTYFYRVAAWDGNLLSAPSPPVALQYQD